MAATFTIHNSRFALVQAVLVLLYSALTHVVAVADTENAKAQLGKYTQGISITPKVDFSGKKLAGCEFVGQDLSKANFSHSDLSDARFLECDLTNANFTGANLRGLRISECKTSRAIFDDASINGLLSADGREQPGLHFSTKQIVSTKSFLQKDLSECRIAATKRPLQLDFSDFNLRDALFLGGDISRCNFHLARIAGASFTGCKFTNQQLHQTRDYQSGRLTVTIGPTNGFDFSGLILNGSDLTLSPGVILDNCQIRDCTLRFSGVDAASVIKATKSYQSGWMSGVDFISADLSNLSFDRVVLSGSRFMACDLTNASFKNAVITAVDFSLVKPSTLTRSQLQSTWNYQHQRMTDIRLPKDLGNPEN